MAKMNNIEEQYEDKQKKGLIPSGFINRWFSHFETDEGKEFFSSAIVGYKDNLENVIGKRKGDNKLVELGIRNSERYLNLELAKEQAEYFRISKKRKDLIEYNINKFQQMYDGTKKELGKYYQKEEIKEKIAIESVGGINAVTPKLLFDLVVKENYSTLWYALDVVPIHYSKHPLIKKAGLEKFFEFKPWKQSRRLPFARRWAKKNKYYSLWEFFRKKGLEAIPLAKKVNIITRQHNGFETSTEMGWEDYESALKSAETSPFALGLLNRKEVPEKIREKSKHLSKIISALDWGKNFDLFIDEEKGKFDLEKFP